MRNHINSDFMYHKNGTQSTKNARKIIIPPPNNNHHIPRRSAVIKNIYFLYDDIERTVMMVIFLL